MTSRAGEFDLIARYFAPLAGDGRVRALGLTDDAALLVPRADSELVLTADALVAGVHFLPDDPPALVARKALRVNLSDLAAKGATPLAYLLCLSLPAETREAWVAGFAEGLAADQEAFAITLAGGDTTSTPGPLTIAITAIGEVASGAMLLRSGAKPGDEIWVSGTIGDAALGLRVLRDGAGAQLPAVLRDELADRYRLPRPRLALGMALAGSGVAAMDVSDGLVQDLGHVARLAGCRAIVDEDAIPFSTAAAALIAGDPTMRDVALAGGDDYELLVAAPPSQAPRLAAASRDADTPLRRIGRLVAGGEGVALRDREGRERRLARGGWTHF